MAVALVNTLLCLLVLFSELLRLAHHALNLLLGQAALLRSDGDLLSLASALVLSTDLQDAVSIDLEGNVNLWHTTWCWWDAIELEFTEEVVVLGHGALALIDLDHHNWLVVLVGREDLRLL